MLSILSIILKVIFIVFFFGFCVFIHEFGHLIVAVWRGLHVEKFSVGMGPRIWGFKYRGIDFIISALPFGGYVSLPQLDPTDAPQSSEGKPLPHASPSARALTAFAGPLFNVLFGFVLAAIMWGAGLWRNAPATSMVISEVPPFLAQNVQGAKLAENDIILAVNGTPVEEFNCSKYYNGAPTWGELGYMWQLFYPGVNDVPSALTLKVQRADSKADAPVVEELKVQPMANPEWQAGLRRGDRIVAVNGKHFTRGVDEFRQEYLLNEKSHITLTVVRDGVEREVTYEPASNPVVEGLGYPFFIFAPPMSLGNVVVGTPAAKAGLQTNDQILTIDGVNVVSARALGGVLRRHAGSTVAVQICRGGREMTIDGLTIPAAVAEKDANPERLTGLCTSIRAEQVMEDTPAQRAGIRAGDRFLTVAYENEAPENITDIREFIDFTAASNGRSMHITGLRGNDLLDITVMPQLNESVTPARYTIGVVLTDGPGRILMHVNPWTQFTEVIGQTTRTLGLLFKPLTSKVRGVVTGQQADAPRNQVGLKHMSGPGGILMMLWFRLQSEGYRGGFAFIILITFSLAFMNLLPLPVLDGGHIVFAGIEAVIHRRLPARAFNWLYNTFAFLLIALMLYITFYDGKRFLKYNSRSDTPAKQVAPANNAKPQNAAESEVQTK
jgi:regulator of sigma E protease